MSIAQNVKRIRLEKKLSPDFIAKKIGKGGRQWIYDLEKGKIQRLSEIDIENLAAALSVTIQELRGENEPEKGFDLQISLPGHDAFIEAKSYKDKYHYLLEENRHLWRENSYLKSLLLKHKIEVYNADNQNETV